MKVAVFGLPDFPLGKKIVPDERVDQLKEMTSPAKTTYLSLELIGEANLKDSDGIIALDSRKADLALLDLELIESRLSRGSEGEEKDFLGRAQQELEKETLISELNLSEAEKKLISNLGFVTAKPVLFLSAEKAGDNPAALQEIYKLMGMIAFFTAGQKELKSWPLRKGTAALEAAGVIHSDIQRGFIKAEVIDFTDIVKHGGLNQAKNYMHLEDKEYIVKDGDVLNFRFSV
jgi:hypothetical protein